MKPPVLPRVFAPSRSGGGMNFAATGPSPAIDLPWHGVHMRRNTCSPRATEASEVGIGFTSVAITASRLSAGSSTSWPVTGTLSVSGARVDTFCGFSTTVWRMSRIGGYTMFSERLKSPQPLPSPPAASSTPSNVVRTYAVLTMDVHLLGAVAAHHLLDARHLVTRARYPDADLVLGEARIVRTLRLHLRQPREREHAEQVG